MRLVELSGNWYKKDCGIIIDYYGEKKILAALIPDSPTSYKIITQKNVDDVRVTKDIADKIDSDAFVCYAGLPKKDLAKLMCSDLWRRIVGKPIDIR